MPDVLRAMLITGGILLAVLIIITVVAFVTVKRGEVQMAEDAKQHGHGGH